MNKYQVLPELTPEEYEALKADIQANGVQIPVEVDEEGNIIDGYHRAKICQELGIDYPKNVRQGLSEEEKIDFVLRVNLNRRHLTREQRQELALKLRRRGWSYPRIGETLGVGKSTVERDVKTTFPDGKVDFPARVIGKDGKERPATRPQIEQPEQFKEHDIDREYEKESPQIAFEPESKPQQYQKPEQKPAQRNLAPLMSSTSPEWYTPPVIIERVIKVLKEIDLDPCSNEGEPNIPATQHFTVKNDGLSQEWHGRIYMNPPYGNEIEAWIKKLHDEFQAGRTTEAIALVPARTDTRWWRILRDFPVCFIEGRLKFSGQENSAPFPSAVFYLGNNINNFIATFEDIGDIYQRITGGKTDV